MKQGNGRDGCYGTMLPEAPVPPRTAAAGKVFSFAIEPSGGLGPPVTSIGADRARWDECGRCPEFEPCYRFSLMKTVLEFMVCQR